MPEGLMSQDESASTLLSFVFSGAIGSPEGKGVSYALIKETPTTFSWSAALDDIDGPAVPVDRFWIDVDRRSKEVRPPRPITLSKTDLSDAILSATGQHLASSTRFTDGALSISYKATVRESRDIAYVVQLRHHGKMASMDSLMTLISKTTNPRILPVPPVFPIPGEKERQEAIGMGRQIALLVPGTMASTTYPRLSHDDKLVFPRLIGELIATDVGGEVVLSVGPDRHHNLAGPFFSVRDYLRAYIKSALVALEKQQEIEEYKDQYLERIRDFVNNRMHNIPAIVEDIPVVAVHSDMGPHNIIVSESKHTEIEAVTDWEFVASAPFASLHRVIEMLFRKSAPNGFGPEYDRAGELRAAFWEAIPDWKRWVESEPTRVFLEWFRFGLFMKPEWRPTDLPESEAKDFWRENIRVVEGILDKYT